MSFYNDGEYADYAQNPYQQYWGAKNNADPEGSSATVWTLSPAAGTPKTEILYDATGYGRISEVKDQWGRKTAYYWNTTDGTLTQIKRFIQPDGQGTQFSDFTYTTLGGQRVLSTLQYATYDGRGANSGGWLIRVNRFFYVQQASTRVVLKAVQRPIVGSQGRITTVYTYDSTDRVTGVNTVDIGNTDYTATASLATNVEPAITYTYGTTNNVYGGKTVTVVQSSGDVNSRKETQYLMNASNQLIMKRVLDDNPWIRANPWYSPNPSRWLEWTYSYTSNGSTKTITSPSGRVEQYTYDFETAQNSVTNPTQAGNVVKQATFISPAAMTGNTPERSQTFTYNIDNQRTQSLTPTLSGTRDGVNYNYSNLQVDTTYAYHTATVSTQTFKPISSITSDTKYQVTGPLSTKFSNIINFDELGRVSSQQRTSPTLTTKTTTYSYYTGASYKPYMPATDASYIQSTRDATQYGNLVSSSNDGQHSIAYFYDWYGNVNIENRVTALSSDIKTNGTPTGNEYRKDRVTMTGFNGFGQKTFENIYEYDRTASFKQWFWYATGELDSSWEAYNTNTTDYTYYTSGVNAGRVGGIYKGEGPGNGGVTTPHESTSLAYDAFGRVNSTTTDGFVTTLSYDTLDRVVLTILPQPYAAQNSMAYSLSGTPDFECSADPSNIYANHCQYKAVDSLGRVTALTHATNGTGQYTINTTFDPYDRPIRVNDNSLEMIVAGEGRSSYIAYDSLGNVVKTLSPIMRNAAMPTAGMQGYGAHTDYRRPYTEFTYDNLGRKTTERKILHNTVDLTTFNNLVNSRTPLRALATSQASTSFAYDTWDRVTTSTDPDGYATTFTYDGMDNVTRQARDLCNAVSACTAHIQYGLSITDTSMTYDAEGRLTTTTDPNGYTKKVQYTLYGSVLSETDSITSGNPSGITRKYYTYTNDGLLATVREPDNASGTPATFAATGSPTGYVATKGFVYGTRKYPISSIETGINGGSTVYTDYTYDFAGRPLTTVLPLDQNGSSATVTQTYNIRGKQTSITDANGFTTRFVYDGWDNLRKETKEARLGNTTDSGAFPNGYGAFNGVTNTGLTTVYDYDLAGNLSRKLEGGLITAYAYNSMGKVSIESKPAKPSVAIGIGTTALPEPTSTYHKAKAYRLDGELVAQTSFGYAGDIFSAQLGVIESINGRPTVTGGNLQVYSLSVGGKRLVEKSVDATNTVKSTAINSYNGLGLRYLRSFCGGSDLVLPCTGNGIYADVILPSGKSGPTYDTHWIYDVNGRIYKKYDSDSAQSYKWDEFTNNYTSTGKISSEYRNVKVYATPDKPGSTAGILVGGSIGSAGTNNQISSVVYNERDQLETSTINEKDGFGNVTPYKLTTYRYFGDGRKKDVTVSGIGTQTFGYDARGRVIIQTDSNAGVTTNTNYSSDGTVTSSLSDGSNTNWSTKTVGGLQAYSKTTPKRVANDNCNVLGSCFYNSSVVYNANGVAQHVINTNQFYIQRTYYPPGCCVNVDPVTTSQKIITTADSTLSYDSFGNQLESVDAVGLVEEAAPSGNWTGTASGLMPKQLWTASNFDVNDSITYQITSTYSLSGTTKVRNASDTDTKSYMTDYRGNRLSEAHTYAINPPNGGTKTDNSAKRYDADIRVVEYDRVLPGIGSVDYVFCGTLPATYSRDHIKFRYDSFGNEILSLHSVKIESNETVSRIGVKTFSYSTVSADDNVQLIAKHVTNVGVEFSAALLCWGATNVNTSTITTKDETFSMFDSVNNPTSEDWNVLKPFSAPVRPTIQLEAPQTSFSSSVGLTVSTLAAPTSPAPPSSPGSITPPSPTPPAPSTPPSSSQPAEVSSAPAFGVTAVNLSTPSNDPAPTQTQPSSGEPAPSSTPTQEFSSSITLEQPINALPTSINTVSVSSLGVPSSVGIPDSGVSALTPPSSGALPTSISSVNVSSLDVPTGSGLPGTVGANPVKPGGSSAAGSISTLGVYNAAGKCIDADNSPEDEGYCKTSKQLADEARRQEEKAEKETGEASRRAALEAARIRAQLAMREELGSDRKADYYVNRMDNSQAYNQLNPKERLEYWTGLRLKIQNKKFHEQEIQDLVFTLENSKVVRDAKGGVTLEYAPPTQGGGGGSAGLTQSSNANATLGAPVGIVIVNSLAQIPIALARAAAAGVAIVVCFIFCGGPTANSAEQRFGASVSLFTMVMGAGSWYINQMAKQKEKSNTTTRPENGEVDVGASGSLPNLGGKTVDEAEKALADSGFVKGNPTQGGYTKYTHPDGSVVWIGPDGEIDRIPAGGSGTGLRTDGNTSTIRPGHSFPPERLRK